MSMYFLSAYVPDPAHGLGHGTAGPKAARACEERRVGALRECGQVEVEADLAQIRALSKAGDARRQQRLVRLEAACLLRIRREGATNDSHAQTSEDSGGALLRKYESESKTMRTHIFHTEV